MQQLDIFADSRDRVLVNTLADAVTCDDVAQARAAAMALQDECPGDRHLAAAAQLIEAMAAEAGAADAPLPAAAVLAARNHIDHTLRPHALTLLGSAAAGTWLAARWHAVARRARQLPFDNDRAAAHAAALWLQGRAWADAAQAVRGIESWRRRPLPLAWMAQASWHLDGPDAAWPLLAELAWLEPPPSPALPAPVHATPRLPALLALLPDARLHQLARSFDTAFDTTTDSAPDWRWWPAWLLVQQPLLATPLDAAQTSGELPPERGFRTVQSLLRLERQGRHHEIVVQRRLLQSLHPALFSAYMATR